MENSAPQSSHIRWLLISCIFVISAIAYLDRVNISIAGPAIVREFDLTNVQLGWVFSAFILGYALFQAPGGSIADKIGPRRTLTIGVIWWGMFTALITAISADGGALLISLIAIRFLLGAGEAVVYPASNCVVAAWIPSWERGIANGIIFAGVGFGAGVTPPLIAYLVTHHGWRSCFWASAIPGFVAGALWYVIARDKPAEHPWVATGELALIESGVSKAVANNVSRLSWSAILRNVNVWAITLSYFSYGYAAYIFFTWFFIYLSTVRQLDIRESSYYTMLPFLAMAIGSPLGGWISDQLTKRWGKRVGRCLLATAAIAICAVFIIIGMRAENAHVASLVLAGGAGSLYLSQSSFWSISADIGKNSAGSVSGFMNMGGQLGGALTASLTPAIANRFGWGASFIVAACLCIAGAAAWLVVRPEPVLEKAAVAT